MLRRRLKNGAEDGEVGAPVGGAAQFFQVVGGSADEKFRIAAAYLIHREAASGKMHAGRAGRYCNVEPVVDQYARGAGVGCLDGFLH